MNEKAMSEIATNEQRTSAIRELTFDEMATVTGGDYTVGVWTVHVKGIWFGNLGDYLVPYITTPQMYV
jgi:hypothetical protein